MCSVDIYPLKYTLDGLERFRSEIEEYFKKRKDVIEKVIKCEVVNYGNNTNLVAEFQNVQFFARADLSFRICAQNFDKPILQ